MYSSTAAAVCRTTAKQRKVDSSLPRCLDKTCLLCAVEHVGKKLGDVFATTVYLRRCAKISKIEVA